MKRCASPCASKHDLRLVGLGLFDDLRGFAFGSALALIGILVGLVDELGLVLLGALHFGEGVAHFRRRVGFFSLMPVMRTPAS